MSETQTARDPDTNGAQSPHVVTKETAYKSAVEAPELLRADAGDITAETVTLDRSGAERISADRVSLERSGAKSITAKSVQMERSGVLSLASDQTVLHDSSAVVVSTREARIVKSRVLFFRSETTTVEGQLRPLIHIGSAGDNVRPVFDSQGAFRFGAALGMALLVGGHVLRLLTRGEKEKGSP